MIYWLSALALKPSIWILSLPLTSCVTAKFYNGLFSVSPSVRWDRNNTKSITFVTISSTVPWQIFFELYSAPFFFWTLFCYLYLIDPILFWLSLQSLPNYSMLFDPPPDFPICSHMLLWTRQKKVSWICIWGFQSFVFTLTCWERRKKS